MHDLPYFCHVCSVVVYPEDKIECPVCREAFLEVYTAEDDSESSESVPELAASAPRKSLFQSLFSVFERPRAKKQPRSITADRRNYAIGPEIHDIITRLREDKQIPEKPATTEQKALLASQRAPDGETCMVCLELFAADEQGVIYPCQHLFHELCSNAWLQFQSECPICRQSL